MKRRCAKVLLFLFLGVTIARSEAARAKPSNDLLQVGIVQEFETLNPIIATMSASFHLYYLAGRPIMSMTPEWKWKCWLCKELPSLEKGTARVVTEGGAKKLYADWELIESAKWGDGTPITGEDVKLSWEIGKSPNVRVGDKDVFDRIEDVIVDAKNPKKFQIKYKEVRYDFYQIPTLFLVPKHLEGPIWAKTKNQTDAYEKQTKFSTDPTNPGLYSGPYRIRELKLGSHIEFVRNEHFYGPQAKIQRLIYKLIPNSQTLEANLLSGTIDSICQLGLTLDQALSLEKRTKRDPSLGSRFSVVYRPGLTYEHVDINLRNPILSDVRVRQALLYGIDRDKLNQALFEGKQVAALHDTHSLDPYFSADVTKYSYDPAKAQALLEQAGWKKGAGGFRFKDGKKLALSIMTTAENKTREQVQVYLQHEWKKIGIDVTIRNEPARVFFSETVRRAKYPALALYAFTSSPDNPPFSTLHSSQIPTEKNGYSGQNRPGWVNKNVDQALEMIQVEFDFAKRKELMKKIQQEYTQELPALPLFMRADIAVVPASMKGFRISGHQFHSTLEAEFWSIGT